MNDKNTEVHILIGVPASGKSTYARENYLPHQIVSSDYARELVCGDATRQDVNQAAWQVVHALIRAKLLAGETTVVVDATSAKSRDRKNLVNRIRTWMPSNATIYGIIFAPTLDEVFKRNSSRDRVVPTDAIKGMMNALKSAPPSIDEGFDVLVVVDNSAKLNVQSSFLASNQGV